MTVEGGGTGTPPTGYYSYGLEYGFVDTCHDITLTAYDQPLEGKYPAFEQEYLRTRVSWTAMVEKDRKEGDNKSIATHLLEAG
ncbi:MAG: hypothetical protein WD431_08765 [Cyclobacteriaceae bacterium]